MAGTIRQEALHHPPYVLPGTRALLPVCLSSFRSACPASGLPLQHQPADCETVNIAMLLPTPSPAATSLKVGAGLTFNYDTIR